jgi:tetratricopeptide (TPR) repeat protein
MWSRMIWAFYSLLLFFPAGPSQVSAQQQEFAQIAHQAEEARTAGRLTDAISLYRRGLKLRSSWSEGWWGLGSIFYDEDRFPEALEAFTRFISTSKKDVAPAYAFLALCEYETRDYVHAGEHFGIWVRNGLPGNTQLIEVASFHWALLLTRGGQFVQALFLLEEKAKRYGISPPLVEAMGLASLRMKNLPEDYPPERREMVWLAGEAAAYGSLHDFDRAQEFAGRLSAHYGQEPNVHYLRGTTYSFEKKTEEAAEEFTQELKISPNHAPAMIQLSFIDLQNSRLEDAMSHAKRAVELEPDDPLARYALGRVLLAADRFQEGADELEVAKKLAPASAKVRFQLARAYRRLGRKADAERESTMFETLKDKAEVLATPEEKLQGTPEEKGKAK